MKKQNDGRRMNFLDRKGRVLAKAIRDTVAKPKAKYENQDLSQIKEWK